MVNSRSQSADATLGWLSHYELMLRWSDRFMEADNDPHSQEALDYGLAFFVWCFSLRDWLKHDERIKGDDLQDFVTNQEYWKHCRDIALRVKHYEISSPSIDPNYGISSSYDPFHKTLETRESIWKVWIDGQQLVLREIIEKLTAGWKHFIESRFSHPSWDI